VSTTRKVLREKVGGVMGLYYNGTCSALGTTATLVDAVGLKSSLKGSQEWVGQYLYRPAAAAAGDMTRQIYTFDPATGTLVPDTAWTNAPANAEAYEIYRYLHPEKEMVNCIDQGLARCFYKYWDILTLVTDGNMETSGVTNWTVSNSAATKVTSGVPRGTQALRSTNAAASGYLRTASIDVRSSTSYFVSVYCRVISGTSVTATLTLYDVTNSAALATDTSTGMNWERLTCAYAVPSTCQQVQVRLTGSALNSITEWKDLVLLPYSVDEIALPSWVTESAYVIDLYEAMGDYLYQHTPLQPWPWWRVVESRDAVVPFTARLSPRPNGHPILIEGHRPYGALSADTTATYCAEELAVAAIRCEAYKWLMASGPLADTQRFTTLWKLAETDFREKSRQYQPRIRRRVQHSEPF